MTRITRTVPVATIHFGGTGFDGVVKTLEGELVARMGAGGHGRTGEAGARITDVRVPGCLAPRTAQQGLEAALPTVRIKAMGRFREPWRGRYRRSVAIAVGGGVAVAPIVDLLRLLASRPRDLPG